MSKLNWITCLILTFAVRSDLPKTLLVDSSMGLLESLDRWVLTHWTEMTEGERVGLPVVHIEMFPDLLGARGQQGAA